MLRRLATALTTLGLAAGLAVGGAAPAQASGGNCKALSFKGTTSASTLYNPFSGTSEYRLRADQLVGSTGTSCSSSAYKYSLVFEQTSAGATWTSESSSVTYSAFTGRTTVDFPALSMKVPTGNGTMKVTLKTYQYAAAYGFWFTSSANDQVAYVKVPGTFDTATGDGIGTGSSCDVPPGTQVPLGYSGWC